MARSEKSQSIEEVIAHTEEFKFRSESSEMVLRVLAEEMT